MPGLKAITDRTDQALHSRAVALYTSLSGVGLAFAYFANGWIADRYGWRWAFAADAVGPLAAGLIALTAMRALAPSGAGPAAGLRESAGQILSNRPALGFILGYAAHSWELFGFRAWMVGYLTFALSGRAGIAPTGATALAAVVAILGGMSNIGSSELIRRIDPAN